MSASIVYVPDDYSTIQSAVDHANAGDTIIVRDGTYTENVNVGKALTIESEHGPAKCIVQAASDSDYVFEVTGSGVTISGFAIKGASLRSGIYIYAENVIVKNNNVSDNGYGISIQFSSKNKIVNNTASNNLYCIFLDRSTDNVVANNTVSTDLHKYGLYLYHANNNVIANNTSSNNYVGIQLDYSSDNSIHLNNFIGNRMSYRGKGDCANKWNTSSPVTYTYNGKKYASCLGNYWSDYKGNDANEDGIGDTPYTPYNIETDKDYYPLMERFENYLKRIQLKDGYVEPVRGDLRRRFNFYVTYAHTENKAPTSALVYIDGEAQPMKYASGSYDTGVLFTCRAKLSTGKHTYHFEFKDEEETASYPEKGELEGLKVNLFTVTLTVIDDNNQPLENASIYMDDILQDETGADGVLSIVDVPRGPHIFKVRKEGYIERKVKSNINRDSNLPIQLEGSLNLVVKSKDIDGNELIGAKITVDRTTYETPIEMTLSKGKYTLSAHTRQFVDGQSFIFLRWEDSEGRDLSTETKLAYPVRLVVELYAVYQPKPSRNLTINVEASSSVP